MSLTQQPALFSRAFQRLFSREIAAAAAEAGAHVGGVPAAGGAADADPATSWLLEGFWRRGPDAPARPLIASAPAGDMHAAHTEQQSSRYLTDFQVGHANAHT